MNTIRTSYTGIRGGVSSGSGTEKKPERESVIDLTPPSKRGFHSIPAPEVLSGLIERAVSALKQGIYWDRGSILNIEA